PIPNDFPGKHPILLTGRKVSGRARQEFTGRAFQHLPGLDRDRGKTKSDRAPRRHSRGYLSGLLPRRKDAGLSSLFQPRDNSPLSPESERRRATATYL